MKVTLGRAAAIAAALTAAFVIAVPVAHAQTIVTGQLCIKNTGNGIWYCLNNREGLEQPYNPLQMWQEGQPQNNWEEFKIGVVNSTWPWTGPYGSLEDAALAGHNVFELEYLGGGRLGTNYCVVQDSYDAGVQTGTTVLGTCQGSPSGGAPASELFVDGVQAATLEAVWATQSAYNADQPQAQFAATPSLTNGGSFLTARNGTAYDAWTWQPYAG